MVVVLAYKLNGPIVYAIFFTLRASALHSDMFELGTAVCMEQRFSIQYECKDTLQGINETRTMETNDKRMDLLRMRYSFLHALRRFLVRFANILRFGLPQERLQNRFIQLWITTRIRPPNRWGTIDQGFKWNIRRIPLDLLCMRYSFIHALRRFLVIPSLSPFLCYELCLSNELWKLTLVAIWFSSSRIWFEI